MTLEALLAVREDLLLETHDRQILMMTACCVKLGRPFTPRHLIHQVIEDEAMVALLIKLGSPLWQHFDKEGACGQLIMERL